MANTELHQTSKSGYSYVETGKTKLFLGDRQILLIESLESTIKYLKKQQPVFPELTLEEYCIEESKCFEYTFLDLFQPFFPSTYTSRCT